ncbi:MAG: carboxypeptidase-like regulatory domain-containing protein [Planctomycetota bacterium]
MGAEIPQPRALTSGKDRRGWQRLLWLSPGCFAGLILLLASPVLLSQGPGLIAGRILTAYGLGPIAGAELRVVVRRDGREITIAQGRSDEEGRYEFGLPLTVEYPQLQILARGHAARCIALKRTPSGEGLLLPDYILDRGASVLFRLAKDSGLDLSKARVQLRLPWPDSKLVDLDAKPLAVASFNSSLEARLNNVPAGPVLFLISDGFRSIAPRLIAWRMGPENIELGPIAVGEGLSIRQTVRAKQSRHLTVQYRFGSGVFDPDGGAEYEFLWRIGAKKIGPLRFETIAKNLSDGVAILRIEDDRGREGLKFSTAPGFQLKTRELVTSSALKGRIRIAGTRDGVAKAEVRIGNLKTTTNAKGDFRLGGLLPGDYRLTVTRTGFLPVEAIPVVVRAKESIADIDLFMAPSARVKGRVRSRRLEALPGALVVGFGSKDEVDLAGFQVYARTDGKGEFDASIVHPGITQIFGMALDGERGVRPRSRELSGNQNIVDLITSEMASGYGRVKLSDRSPVGGCDVYIATDSLDADILLGPDLKARWGRFFVGHTMTDPEGGFSFSGVPPGSYRMVFRRPDLATYVTKPINLAAGDNRIGLDWRLPEPLETVFDLVPTRPYRLLPKSPGLEERWLVRAENSDPLKISGLSPSEYRLEPLWLFEEPPEATRNIRAYPGAFGREGSRSIKISNAVITANSEDSVVPYGNVRALLRIGGRAPGDRPVVLTRFPISGPAGALPQRIEAFEKNGRYEWAWPRGTYVVHVAVPGFGAATSPPFRVGINAGESRVLNLPLEVDSFYRAAAYTQLRESHLLASGGFRIQMFPRTEKSLLPWRLKPLLTTLDRRGGLEFLNLPAGPGHIQFRGQQLSLGFATYGRGNDFVDYGRLKFQDQLRPSTLLHGKMQRRLDLRHPQQASFRLDDQIRGALWRPGTYKVSFFDSLRFTDQPLLSYRSQFFGIRSATENSAAKVRRRSDRRLTGSLRVGGDKMPNWPFKLIPLTAGGYRLGSDEVSGFSDEFGRLHVDKLDGGGWTMRLRYLDSGGHEYTYHEPFTFAVRRRRHQQAFQVVTNELPIAIKHPTNQQAVAGALVRLYRADFRGVAAASAYQRDAALVVDGYTDRRGRLVLTAVPHGVYDIKVSSWDFGETILKDVTVDETRRRRDLEIKLDLGASLSVYLYHPDGRPVQNAQLFLYDAENAEALESQRLRSSAEGRLQIDGLASGVHTVFAQSADHPPQFVGEVELNPGGEGQIDAQLTPGVALRLEVVNSGKRPVARALVSISSQAGGLRLFEIGASGADELPNRSDSRGFIELNPFPIGDYKIVVEALGWEPVVYEGKTEGLGRQEIRVVLKKKTREQRTR